MHTLSVAHPPHRCLDSRDKPGNDFGGGGARAWRPETGVDRAVTLLLRRPPYFAAIAMISTNTSGKAMRASQVARPGVFAGSTQASQTAFISS
jgi:hypothetical protein